MEWAKISVQTWVGGLLNDNKFAWLCTPLGVFFVDLEVSMENAELLNKVKADGVMFISLQFTDIMGTIKSVTIPVNRLKEALERGVWFDGSSIQGKHQRICGAVFYL